MADGFDWSSLATILGNVADAQGAAKKDQNSTALDQFRTELAGRIAEQNAASKRASDIRTAPGDRLAQGATGEFVSNFQPVKTTWGGAGTAPVTTGGIGVPGQYPNTKYLADSMQSDAVVRSQQGWNSPDIAPFLVAPDAPTMSKSSWLDSLLGIAGPASNLLGLLGGGKNGSTGNGSTSGKDAGSVAQGVGQNGNGVSFGPTAAPAGGAWGNGTGNSTYTNPWEVNPNNGVGNDPGPSSTLPSFTFDMSTGLYLGGDGQWYAPDANGNPPSGYGNSV